MWPVSYVILLEFLTWALYPAAFHYTWWSDLGLPGISATPRLVEALGATALSAPEFSSYINPGTGMNPRALQTTIDMIRMAEEQIRLNNPDVTINGINPMQV